MNIEKKKRLYSWFFVNNTNVVKELFFTISYRSFIISKMNYFQNINVIKFNSIVFFFLFL